MRRIAWTAMGLAAIYAAGFAHGVSTIYVAGPAIGAKLQHSGAWLSGMGTVTAITTTAPAAQELAKLAGQPAPREVYVTRAGGTPVAADWGTK